MNSASGFAKQFKRLALITGSAFGVYSIYGLQTGDETFYKKILMPVVHQLPPEFSHKLAVFSLKYKLMGNAKYTDPETLNTKLCGCDLKNPIGIAAGFDKNGQAVVGLQNIGFGFVEVGSVTPKPQPGNPKPRIFRLMEDKAIINRYGFNSDGHEKVFHRLSELRKDSKFQGILGVNLGKNKTSTDATLDYIDGVKLFGPIADYLVVNVSSPNTPGLRNLQGKEDLENLLKSVIDAKKALSKNVPIFLKIDADLTPDQRKEVAAVVMSYQCRVDGIIIANTTIERPIQLQNQKVALEDGGLSGAPLFERSTQMIREMYLLTGRKIPIIGVGGVSSGKDAYEKILAGASAVQLYTSFAYNGPSIIIQIKKELDELLRKDGYKCVAEAIGKGNK